MLPFLSKTLLFPYWLTLKIRHFLYDSGIFKETAYPVPVVCVGNITVGGTGKTPFTEMIIRHLQDKYRIAVLSRGYKRESKGFVLATENSTHREIGDDATAESFIKDIPHGGTLVTQRHKDGAGN
ncbi:MAG: tetraacyldisaccharide 4'-kinase, partial [Bacteroidales bacterium]|nr:tetraacyldisaccharide 4'-kinase [Bacteroidales bacterium]